MDPSTLAIRPSRPATAPETKKGGLFRARPLADADDRVGYQLVPLQPPFVVPAVVQARVTTLVVGFFVIENALPEADVVETV